MTETRGRWFAREFKKDSGHLALPLSQRRNFHLMKVSDWGLKNKNKKQTLANDKQKQEFLKKLKLVPSGEYIYLDGKLGKDKKISHFIMCSLYFFIFSIFIHVCILH